MKQISIAYTYGASFREQLSQLKTWMAHRAHRRAFFQILSVRDDEPLITEIARMLAEVFPGAAWHACCTAGNIANSQIAADITVIATVFESPDTFFKLAQYEITAENMSDVTTQILNEIRCETCIKAVELYLTLQEFSVLHFCRLLDGAPRDVHIAGGFSGSPSPTSTDTFVASSAGSYTKKGLVAVFYGGADFHVETYKISGWTPLGKSFRVTKAIGRMLYEIDGAPAFDIYHKYLNIENDENFFLNALEFPLIYENEGASIMRVPGASTPERALLIASPIETGTRVRLAYGHPQSVMDCVYDAAERANDFFPDVLHIFSCLARKIFWAFREPDYELAPFKDIARSSGFFSHGEFIRENGHLNQHSMTLVIVAMREGDVPERPARPLPPRKQHSSHIPLTARMGSFIRETTYELEETNSRLQAMVQQLQGVALTDSLTGLGNRMAFDKKIEEIATEGISPQDWVMLMLDVNGLKYTNDIFGHAAGDSLILAAANAIRETYGKQGECYRLGGDEFVVLILTSLQELDRLHTEFADALAEYNKTSIYRLSVARGESHLNNACGLQRSISDWKMDADLAMYRNKASSHRKRDDSNLHDLRGLIDCVISLEEAKDPYTAHHSERVRALSELLARKLGLSEQTVCLVTDAAHLHDIGKIGINEGVLTKPARLSMTELNIIRQHPVIGARILMKANRMQEVVRIVMHHHERWNGTGYPDGLAREDIPIGARIIAIADSIDAMCSRRCYRESLSFKQCREEIRRNLGIMYDPAIGKVALDNWDEIEELLLTSLKHLEGDGEETEA